MSVSQTPKEKIVFCHCAYTRILPEATKQDVLDQLKRSGVAFEEVEDLCRMAAQKDPGLDDVVEADQVHIAACYPRAVKWLFHAAGVALDEEKVQVHNMREDEAQDIGRRMVGEIPERETPLELAERQKPEDPWKPWFPVIDFDRCTNCMQCLSFCLFDVYGVSSQKQIEVQNPSKCKTDCPACSRVCPEAAILFPKYRAAPINGAEVSDEDLRREKMKVDISSLLGGDIYSMLRDRTQRAKSRFSKERDEERALKERKRCLKKLKDGLDIPQEVIDALPSAETIRSKAGKSQAS